jgi:hypothetical protein
MGTVAAGWVGASQMCGLTKGFIFFSNINVRHSFTVAFSPGECAALMLRSYPCQSQPTGLQVLAMASEASIVAMATVCQLLLPP